jgi:aminoglycoside phosphotransferase (APT) family kinase protein
VIHEDRVSRWLEDNIEGLRAPFSFHMIAGGRSNITYRVVDANGRTVVLRRPPLGHVLATAHDMGREHRIISAVGTTGVPVPRTLGMCTDVEVNDAPFYVMSYVDGVVLDGQAKAANIPPATRRALSEHLIDVMVDLHAVDVDAVGLGDLAKRDSYVERQIKRWSTQWANSKQRELPDIDEVERLLKAGVPQQHGTVIAHGDYRFGNCLSDPERGRIEAVLDWELCTLGDPMADIGYLGVYWSDPGLPARRENDPSGLEGFPTYREMVDMYSAKSGRNCDNIGYYVAFSSWRLAVISEGVYARYVHGAMGKQDFDPTPLRRGVELLVEAALTALQHGV